MNTAHTVQEQKMSKKVEYELNKALSIAFAVYEKQGYVKSITEYSPDEPKKECNKKLLTDELDKNLPVNMHPKVAELDSLNKDLFFKKMSGKITEYEELVLKVLSNKIAKINSLGIVASIPLMYSNFLKQKTKEERYQFYQDQSQHMGIPGHKFSDEVVCIDTNFLSYKGFYIYVFEHNGKNILKWMTGKELSIQKGDKVKLSGVVKAHTKTNYYGDETLLSRCKVEQC